jgi:DNA repair protein RecO (recombination protein O)
MMGGGNVTTEAIVLAATDVGEEDRILTFITPGFGLLKAAATSARNLRKGRTAPLDLFVRTSLDINAPGRGGKLKRIGSANVIEPFLGIRADYKLLCAASYLGQTIAYCVQEDDPSLQIYDLVLHCLRSLDRGVAPFNVLLLFEVRFLNEMGLLPELKYCLQCGEEVTGDVYLDERSGGVTHRTCLSGEYKGALTSGDLAVLRYLYGKSLSRASKLSIREQDAVRVFELLHPFTVHHLGYRSGALEMMKG